METKNQFSSDIAERELVITRTFDAPAKQVWKSLTDPNLVIQWWGPKGFTCPVCRIDLRVGGSYLNCMRSPEGQNFWSKGNYQEIIEPNKLVMTDSFADENGNTVHASHYGMQGDWPLEMQIILTLEEIEGKTNLTLEHLGLPIGEMLQSAESGWNESFDKLAETFKNKSESTVFATLNAYLNFPGNTEEAFNFYKSVFGGEFSTFLRFRDTPEKDRLPANEQDKIMHVALPIGKGSILMATDALESMGHTLTVGNNFHLCLFPESREEVDRIFNALSEGGKVEIPLNDTFWGAYHGMLQDKFGIKWMLDYEKR